SAILIGHPAAISSSLLLVPIAIFLSVVLPGNRVILFADLAVIPFVVALAAPIVRGNVLRMVIIGTVTLGLGFYMAGALAPLFTKAAVSSGFAMPEGASQITAIGDGFVWLVWATLELVQVFGILGLVILAICSAAALLALVTKRATLEKLAGGEDDAANGANA
ncbi:MAG: PTS transporter subunit IIC, partial [Pannonibacter indicus]